MFHRFNIPLASLVLAFALTANTAQAAVSYFVIQGDFNAGSAGLETYKWKVEYNPSSLLLTAQDLLLAVAGPSTFSATYLYGGTYVESVTMNGTTITEVFGGPNDGKSWFNLVSGGSFNTSWSDPLSGTYPANVWTQSHGINERDLGNNSFDALVFGEFGEDYYPTVTVNGVQPTLGDFAGTETLISSAGGINIYSIAAAPEPSRSILLLFAGIALVTRRRRTFSSVC